MVHSPHLKQFADESLVFERAYCQVYLVIYYIILITNDNNNKQ